MITFIVVYFLIAVYVAQHITIIGWHYNKWDVFVEYFCAVCWLPVSFVVIIFIILEKLSGVKDKYANTN